MRNVAWISDTKIFPYLSHYTLNVREILMGFFRWRTNQHGRHYLYYEERYRQDGKVKSRSVLIRGSGSKNPRKDAMERYRDVLRENVMLFGRSRPGERYQRTADARDAYQRFLDTEKLPDPPPDRPMSKFEVREMMYKVGHPTPASRVATEFLAREQAARDEPAPKETASYPSRSTPTDEEEAMHAQWSANQAAERDEIAAEYAEHANAEAESESAPDTDAPASEGEAT